MSTIIFEEIQKNPQTFLRRIVAGESLLILRANKPIAELTSLLTSVPNQETASLHGSVLKYEMPFEPTMPLEDWVTQAGDPY